MRAVGEFLSVEDAGGVAVVRIDRPPANALAPDLLDEGAELVASLAADSPDAVVLTGTGSFFSAGVDLKLLPALPPAEQAAMVPRINRAFCDWYGLRRPLVAAVNGHAVAGGFILFLCADHRVGVAETSYGLTELRVGAPYPAAAMTLLKAELSPRAARRLVLGADLIDGREALELGAIDELAEPADVLDRAVAVARELAALPRETYELVKEQLRGPTLREMQAESERDPLARGWLSGEMPGAVESVLGGSRA